MYVVHVLGIEHVLHVASFVNTTVARESSLEIVFFLLYFLFAVSWALSSFCIALARRTSIFLLFVFTTVINDGIYAIPILC